MLKEAELRVGNYYRYDQTKWNYADHKGNFKWSVRDWIALGESTMMLEDVDSIPLTEEWLLKFSAEKIEDNGGTYYSLQIGNNLNLTINLEDKTPGIDLNWRAYGSQLWSKVDYVHQLQNTFYFLTGEELEVKP